MSTVVRKLKSFKVSSGTIGIGDPCYDYHSVESEAKNGKWVAHVEMSDEGSWGNRIARITIHHEDFNPAAKLSVEENCFFVDSGQAGVFDGNYEYELNYESACSMTLGKEGYGFLNNGFVSSSGYGDGSYPCLIYKNKDEAVCVEITFIEK